MEWNKRLILASASPRRRELLGRFGLPFEVIPARGEEHPPAGAGPEETVLSLARTKAREVAARDADPAAAYVAADTIVELDGVILGKPADAAEARAMLLALSGRTHRVWSGLCVILGDRELCESECTEVRFRPLTEAEIDAYVATGEPLDKAGAYGIQGLAALFAEGIRGDYFNVMGLPLCRLGQMLSGLGISLLG